jgi:hypothetical protein
MIKVYYYASKEISRVDLREGFLEKLKITDLRAP